MVLELQYVMVVLELPHAPTVNDMTHVDQHMSTESAKSTTGC